MGKLVRVAPPSALALVLVLAGCTSQEPARTAPVPSTPLPSVSASSPAASSTPSPLQTPTPAEPAGPDELTVGALQHTVRSNGLTVSIVYVPEIPVDRWTAEGSKPVQVSMTVKNNGRPKQKVFVTRATMRFTVNDGIDDIPGPDPLVDTANIIPGYLATSPHSYNQSFAVPPLDVGARRLTIDLKLEMVSLVDSKTEDYTKQTVTDAVRATLPS